MKTIAASRFMSRSPRRRANMESARGRAVSPAQRPHYALVRQRLLRSALEDDFTPIDHAEPSGEGGCAGEIRSREKEKNPKAFDHNARIAKSPAHHRRQPPEGLVEDHQRGGKRHGARDRPHFLLPAAEIEPWPTQEL